MKATHSLIQRLPENTALDIVGDIHGEIDALNNLLTHLGYDENGNHPENRYLVFVGDFIDRGINSPAVISRIKTLVETKHAFAILGNHELNLLNSEEKDGSGWFFPHQRQKELHRYISTTIVKNQNERDEIINFLNSLPVALERSDLRVVHAAWLPQQIDKIRQIQNLTAQVAYENFKQQARTEQKNETWYQAYLQEHHFYHEHSEDENFAMPFLDNICLHDLFHGQANPMRAITCGVEIAAEKPFFAAGRWRFITRCRWWNEYDDNIPVIIGHYWRQWRLHKDPNALLFPEASNHWLGKRKNVFCIDFSIGALWKTRLAHTQHNVHKPRLAAFRLPENILIFDNGEKCCTIK